MHSRRSRLADAALLYVLIGAGIGGVQAVSGPGECGPVGERLIDSGAKLTVPQLLAWPYHLYVHFQEEDLGLAELLVPTRCVQSFTTF